MDSAKEVMAWDRIGFVVIEGFFCFLVVLPGLVGAPWRGAGFADWMPMHPWMDQDGGNLRTDTFVGALFVGEKPTPQVYSLPWK